MLFETSIAGFEKLFGVFQVRTISLHYGFLKEKILKGKKYEDGL